MISQLPINAGLPQERRGRFCGTEAVSEVLLVVPLRPLKLSIPSRRLPERDRNGFDKRCWRT